MSSKPIQIEINGKKAEFPEEITILQAAQELSIYIPTLCYHRALSPYGACRVCVVEVTQGTNTVLKSSCDNVILPGMVIQTDSERVKRSRKVIIELMLARNPDAPAVQELAAKLGIGTARFNLEKRDCVLCGLCVRVCEERMGKSAISFANRGTDRAVVSPFDQRSEVCQTCGACETICPANCVDLKIITDNQPRPLLSHFEANLTTRSPIYLPYPQAVPKLALIDKEHCIHLQNGDCGICKDICQVGAIDFEQKEQALELEVGSVIFAPGFEEFHAEAKGEFGFGRYPNVMTTVQFERMLSAAGPYEGHVVRRSDGREAKRIAWIQCVGSRDSSCGNDYCSSICCMASTKQAMIAREHVGDMQGTIFYMDIRAHGKDFDQYYERAQNYQEIDYIKSIPSRILQVPDSNDLRLRYLDEKNHPQEMDFDLVILSVGMTSSESVQECAERLEIELDTYGFCATDRFAPLKTSRPGVFVAGSFQEPKDIPETVTQASGAAVLSMQLLTSARNTMITKKTYPTEHDPTDEQPRIGVFICHCGSNIASVVDVARVTEAVANQPGVVFASHTMYTCSDTSLSDIRDKIHEYRLNRIVVASCTPRTHEPLFRETLREAGMNPYLFEMANIRDQCSWVHSGDSESATKKAIDLVRMAIGRARFLKPLFGSSLPVIQTTLVIGGGLSGMTAALALANQGFKVHLVERTAKLGGNLNDLYFTLEHEDVSRFTRDMIQKIENHSNIELYLETEVTSVAGHVGHFTPVLMRDGQKFELDCGAIIVATGGERAQTSDFLYGQSNQVMTQVELEKQLHENTFSADSQNIVMIQCVGSRNDDHAYCSRICCSMAVKNALKIKKQNPKANIYILYRDIRTYGFREIYYKKAREAGVVFIRYQKNKLPQVAQGNGLLVTLDSPDFPETLEIEADNIILSTGVETPPSNKALSDMLKVPLNADGFYVEAHLKLRPVDFATEGVFLCGMAHSPKFMDENIAQAQAAAARASTVISKTHLDVSAQTSVVDQDKCISCMTCTKVCPYTAPYVNKDSKAQIEAAKCMGCGICVAECPACAIQLNHFMTDQFTVMVKEFFKEDNGPGRDGSSPKKTESCACLTGKGV